MSYFTVCTPTYNRAHLLKRPFDSLQRQTFKDFEWLIIDDGSIDNTQEVVDAFIEQADFKIIYVKTENRGKAAALNESYKHINTDYVVNLDSDDEYTDDALQKMYDIWENMPKETKDRVWCITGNCIDSKTREVIGGTWPEDINLYTGRRQRKQILKYKKGEKSCCRKTAVLKHNLFPQYPDTKFVSEAIIWEKINREYDQYCTNDVFRIYYREEADSLSVGKSYNVTRKITYYYLSLFYVNQCFDEFFINKNVPFSLLNLSRCALVTKREFKRVMGEIDNWYKRVLVLLGYPISWLFVKAYYAKRGRD